MIPTRQFAFSLFCAIFSVNSWELILKWLIVVHVIECRKILLKLLQDQWKNGASYTGR